MSSGSKIKRDEPLTPTKDEGKYLVKISLFKKEVSLPSFFYLV